MNKLVRMTLKGYKSIRELHLELRPLTLLIGANGAGKSNFIGAFKLLNHLVNQNLQLHVARAGGADQILHYGRQNTERLVIDLCFAADEDRFCGYHCSLAPAAGDTLVFEDERTASYGSARFAEPTPVYFGAGQKESALAQKSDEISRNIRKVISNWKVYHFHDTGEDAKVKQNCDIDDNDYLRTDASNLAAYLYYLREKQTPHYRGIIDFIRLAAPFFDDFSLRPNPLNPRKIKLEWREKGTDAYFDANSLSDGTLRLMSLATLLLQPVERLPAIILLDEPELGLHPYAITLLAELLRSTATHTQIIAATQSVTLVNQFEPADVIVVDRQGRQSVFRRLDAADIASWLDDYDSYGLGDLWEKNVFGGRPSV
ncbi:MAG: AAA family ATPase [Caldilineales bacterium]|nr:AAA family ATPase [Caldilineales bacterium]